MTEIVNFNAVHEGHIGPDEPCWLVGLPNLEREGETAIIATVHNANRECAAAIGRFVSSWFGEVPFTICELKGCSDHAPGVDRLGEAFTYRRLAPTDAN